MPIRQRNPNPRLSPRLSSVVALIAEGKANKQIAAELGLSIRTVVYYVHLVMNKLGVDNRTEIAVWHLSREFRQSCSSSPQD